MYIRMCLSICMCVHVSDNDRYFLLNITKIQFLCPFPILGGNVRAVTPPWRPPTIIIIPYSCTLLHKSLRLWKPCLLYHMNFEQTQTKLFIAAHIGLYLHVFPFFLITGACVEGCVPAQLGRNRYHRHLSLFYALYFLFLSLFSSLSSLSTEDAEFTYLYMHIQSLT